MKSTNQKNSSTKQSGAAITPEEIIRRCARYTGVLREKDIDNFLNRHNKKPYDREEFKHEMFWLLKKRHLEDNQILEEIENGFEDSYVKLNKAHDDLPKRLRALRSGNQKFGPSRVRYPLKQRDVAFCIRYWEQNYQKIEAKKMGISSDVLIRLCSFYQVSADTILFGYHPFGIPEVNSEILKEKDEQINSLKQENNSLKKINSLQEDLIEVYKKK